MISPTTYDTTVERKRFTVGQIKAATAAVCGITVRELVGHSRERRYARPRQIAFYLSVYDAHKSLPQIGGMFNRDHTTVLHGIRAVQVRPKCIAKVDEIRRVLRRP